MSETKQKTSTTRKSQPRSMEGVVVSDKMNKSIVVKTNRRKQHHLGKFVNCSKKIHAHDEDNKAHVGDKVIVRESRPYAKTKTWVLETIIQAAHIKEGKD